MKKSLNATGGGKLTSKERRIVHSPLYRETANKMGVSATGNDPRFDSDSQDSVSALDPPTKRLREAEARQNLLADNLNISDECLNFDISLGIPEDARTSFENILSQATTPATASSLQRPPQTRTAKTATATATATNATVTSSQRIPVRTPTTSSQAVSSRVTTNTPLSEHLNQQVDTSSLHKQYLEMQIERTKIAIEREKLQMRLVEIEVLKAETLWADEVEHKKLMMELEAQAMRRESEKSSRE